MKDLIELIVAIIACLLCFIFGINAGHGDGAAAAEKRFQKEAIARGYASYNPTNGVWQWKESK